MATLTSVAVSAIVPASVKQRLFDWLVEFTAQQAERLAGEEIGKRIKGWRSDGQVQRRVDAAIERAAACFLEQWPDREMAQVLAGNTRFADLPSVRQSLRDLWRHPFDPAPHELLRGKFGDILGKDADPQRVDAAVAGYLVQLRAELIGVPGVREVLAVMAQHETVVELRDIRAVLNQILSRLPEPPNLANLRQRLVDFLTEDCAWFDTRGLPQVREVVRLPVDEVYVPLSAEPTGLVDLSELAREYVGRLSLAEGEEMPRKRGQPWLMERVPAQSLLPLHRRLVILGEPGAGKTTLLRYIALVLSRNHGEAHLGLAGDWLPILVPIQFYNEALREQRGSLALIDYLPQYFATRGVRGLGPLLEHELARGRCVVLLDGLDEVLDSDHRAEVVARVIDFLRAYRANRFVVTSRIAGYSGAPLDETFTLTTVLPFNDGEIRTFAHQWYRAYETRGEKDRAAAEETARQRAEALVEQIKGTPAVRCLAGNPLLLTILAVIHRQGTRLPAQRVELYRLCVEALAESWNRARSIGGRPIELNLGDQQLDEDYAVRFLAPVALYLHETSEGLIGRDA
jgi:energy-coupling factor transporter ATP-binding protein EcfA2